MQQEDFYVIGVMSGTSLDGIDLAYVQFSFLDQKWSYRFIHTQTRSYPLPWREKLQQAVHLSRTKIQVLDEEYTHFLAGVIADFIREKKIQKLDLVSSHGHTIFHQPERNFTFQIGNRSELAQLLRHQVACDFRVQDVKLGGQGAPLVPIGDHLLFSEYQACINLGGFSNISLIENNERIAYDVCAVNTVLNTYAQRLGRPYDEGGALAQSGKVDQNLIKELNQLEYYTLKPPKSLGIEWVKRVVLPLLNAAQLKAEDVLATYTLHIAQQLALALPTSENSRVLLTGGGAYNDFLLTCLKEITNATLVVPGKELIEYKEALLFGFLGVLRLKNQINVLKSVTGASQDHCSGKLFLPSR